MFYNLLIGNEFVTVLKTGDPKGFQSSNLCASARLNKGLPKGSPFVFWGVRTHLEYSLGIFSPVSLTADKKIPPKREIFRPG
ncbi:hypothetical protein DQZ83_22505 [Salmonella enterica subsp. enterica serovar Oranienburg]|nr:hypothetical protein [Salmonella enterica]EBQ9991650.1 hypothetical protein [Salmonella enterica subsp. enterica serovar Oranienburg]EBZ1027760.1 hypothetical protein [Salmonella enterica subsp. enterica serovar Muenchen]EBI7018507.1 hypothetical protein [Salmonella enterica]EBO3828900.1 hypothetical protein [Salmonella enterica]